MNERLILVVASDYDIVVKVQHALKGKGFSIYSAYSHKDASYAFSHVKHDLAMVDAEMTDRVTGTPTLVSMMRNIEHPPIIAIATNGGSEIARKVGADQIVTNLEDELIQQHVMQALKIPELKTKPLAIDDTIIERDENLQRIAEIQALFALSRSLTEVLNLSEVLNRVVEAARHLTNAEEGMLLLPDEDEPGQLVLRAKVGIDSDAARNFSIRTTDTLAGVVFNRGEPLRIAEQGPQKVKTEYFVNALLYVPIALKGKSMGVLGVNNKLKHNVFTTRHQELLLSLASYAAIAIENARIHEDSVKRARELKAMVDASEVINSSMSLDRTLPNICQQLAEVLGVGRTDILEWNGQENRLQTLARYQRMVWRRGFETLIQLDRRPRIRTALEDGQALLLNRKSPDFETEVPDLERDGIHTLLVMPVGTVRETLGAVLAAYNRPPATPPDTGAILGKAHALAWDVLTPLLDRAATPDMDALFELVGQMRAVLGADWCELAQYTPRDRSLRARLAVGSSVWVTSPQPGIALDDFPELRQTMETQVPFNDQRDQKPSDSAVQILDYTQSRAAMAVPLVNRGQVAGVVLFADSERGMPFTAREVDVARAVVGQAATALDNAHLVHDLELSLKELRETQDRLVQTARLSAMGEMAAAVAHQINNPLTTIVLDTELMLLSETSDSPRVEQLHAIHRSGKRAAGVVRRLLATARMPSADASMEPINITTTVIEIVDLVKAHIERARVSMTVRVPTESLPPVLAVPGELDDVWLNLLLNGNDAVQGRQGAELGIEVRYNPADERIEVAVWDNGSGIPPSVINEIFKPFFTTKPVGQGTGLGLHICRQVVERVGGTISVSSEKGVGTRFLVRLPIQRGG
jgi:signal transduction histidine kinase